LGTVPTIRINLNQREAATEETFQLSKKWLLDTINNSAKADIIKNIDKFTKE